MTYQIFNWGIVKTYEIFNLLGGHTYIIKRDGRVINMTPIKEVENNG